MSRRDCLTGIVALVLFSSLGCGYHTGGQGVLIPKGVNTIHVGAFSSATTRYRLVDLLPQQIEREFVAHGRFGIDNDPATADALLNGTVNTATIIPTTFDPATGRATNVQVLIYISYQFVERATGRVLFSRNGVAFRQNYSISADPHQFLDEVGPALDRVARDVGRDVVSSVLESF